MRDLKHVLEIKGRLDLGLLLSRQLSRYRSPCRSSEQSLYFSLTFLKWLIPVPLTRRERSKLQKTSDGCKHSPPDLEGPGLSEEETRSQSTVRNRFHKCCPPILPSCNHAHPTPPWQLRTSLLQLTGREAHNQPQALCSVILGAPQTVLPLSHQDPKKRHHEGVGVVGGRRHTWLRKSSTG